MQSGLWRLDSRPRDRGGGCDNFTDFLKVTGLVQVRRLAREPAEKSHSCSSRGRPGAAQAGCLRPLSLGLRAAAFSIGPEPSLLWPLVSPPLLGSRRGLGYRLRSRFHPICSLKALSPNAVPPAQCCRVRTLSMVRGEATVSALAVSAS